MKRARWSRVPGPAAAVAVASAAAMIAGNGAVATGIAAVVVVAVAVIAAGVKARRGVTLECGEFPPLSAGDLSPSKDLNASSFVEPLDAAWPGRPVGPAKKRRQVATRQGRW